MNRIVISGRSRLSSKLRMLTVLIWASSIQLHAAAAGNLPWERPMQTIATSLTGPVAYAIGLIGIAIAGGTMLWGGELTEIGQPAGFCAMFIAMHRNVSSPLGRMRHTTAKQSAFRRIEWPVPYVPHVNLP